MDYFESNHHVPSYWHLCMLPVKSSCGFPASLMDCGIECLSLVKSEPVNDWLNLILFIPAAEI